MALSMLVDGGADCGPVNPLRNLTKRFDLGTEHHQRNLNAEHISIPEQSFRASQSSMDPSIQQDIAHFFQPGPSSSKLPSWNQHPFLMSGEHMTPPATLGWASDFLSETNTSGPPGLTDVASAGKSGPNKQTLTGSAVQPMLTVPSMSTLLPRINPYAGAHASQLRTRQDTLSITEAILNLELDQTEQASVQQKMTLENDELSRTAGLLVQAMDEVSNPKFRTSSFLSLMRQLRDKEKIVEGDRLVDHDGSVNKPGRSLEAKSKGKAPVRPESYPEPFQTQKRKSVHFQHFPSQIIAMSDGGITRPVEGYSEDDLDEYFRQENDDLRGYWSEHDRAKYASRIRDSLREAGIGSTRQQNEWDHLQEDWDKFEVHTTGIVPVAPTGYAFSKNNPYLDLNQPRERNPQHHVGAYEGVLQLEAHLQRDATNALAWYNLGIKQQENERELLAIEALSRSIALNPSHLDGWLALAVSYANEGQKENAYNAIDQWVRRNTKYSHMSDVNTESSIEVRLRDNLINMAKSTEGCKVDADIQIALAVILNIEEDYLRAQDCFRSALEAKPNDWLLYNRVGATLANSGDPEEALKYYYRALELNPTYVRALFNLGISCMTLRRHREAAGYILDALMLQEGDGTNPEAVTSGALWDALRTTCAQLERLDLAALCDSKNLPRIRESIETMEGV